MGPRNGWRLGFGWVPVEVIDSENYKDVGLSHPYQKGGHHMVNFERTRPPCHF